MYLFCISCKYIVATIKFPTLVNNLDTIVEEFMKQLLLCLITQFFETNLKNFKREYDKHIFQYFPNQKKHS